MTGLLYLFFCRQLSFAYVTKIERARDMLHMRCLESPLQGCDRHPHFRLVPAPRHRQGLNLIYPKPDMCSTPNCIPKEGAFTRGTICRSLCAHTDPYSYYLACFQRSMIPTTRKLNTINVRACLLPSLVVALSCQRMDETNPCNFSPMSFILFIAMADLTPFNAGVAPPSISVPGKQY